MAKQTAATILTEASGFIARSRKLPLRLAFSNYLSILEMENYRAQKEWWKHFRNNLRVALLPELCHPPKLVSPHLAISSCSRPQDRLCPWSPGQKLGIALVCRGPYSDLTLC